MTAQAKVKAGIRFIVTISLLTGTLLFAAPDKRQRTRLENLITFNGHEFLWREHVFDSMEVKDVPTGKVRMLVSLRKEGGIYDMDGDTVYSNSNAAIARARFAYGNQSFDEYMGTLFKKEFPALPGNIRSINISNLVINEQGKLSYYEIECTTDKGVMDLLRPGTPYARYGKAIEKMLQEAPDWQPATFNDKKVKAYSFRGALLYNKR